MFLAPMTCQVFCALSLDGYIARPDGAIDWLPDAPEDHGYEAFMAGVDALVMGRKTFELVLSFPGWPYTKPVFVVTHRPLRALPASHQDAVVERVEGKPTDIVAKLAARGLKSLYVDGGQVVTQFLAADLVDRMVLTRIPVLLGEGIPLFGGRDGSPGKDQRWRHVRTQSYPSGLVQSEYRRDAASS